MRCYKKMSQHRLISFCELPQRPVSDSSFPSSSLSGDSWVLLSYEKKSQHRFLSFCDLPKRPVSDRVVHRAKSPKLAQFHLRDFKQTVLEIVISPALKGAFISYWTIPNR